MAVILLSTFCYLCSLSSVFSEVHGTKDYGAVHLSPHIKSETIAQARNVSTVESSPLFGLESYSGFITVKEKYDSNLFFWYFPHKTPRDVPWIIWLQGGPGFTSLLGVFEGIGPMKIADGKVLLRDFTWANDYSLLFIDNPVGVGFSYTKDAQGYTKNEDEVGEQLMEFLVQFLQLFPELQKTPLFLAGESYAGKYLPAFGAYIHRQRGHHPINFKGIIIGNGLIDPKSQLTEGHSELCELLGLVEGEDLVTLRQIQGDCVGYIDAGKMLDAANKFNESIEFIKEKSGVNIYNFDKDPSTTSHLLLEKFLTDNETRRLVHVGSAPFDFNNQHVYNTMLPDIMNSTKPFLEELLEHYGVLSYTGQLDVILPYAVAKPMYAQLKWSRRCEYERAPRVRMREPGSGAVAAYSKSGGNFVDVLIRHAGHMVTAEQPEVCKSIVDAFIEKFK